MMLETLHLTSLALLVVSLVAAPWSAGSAVGFLRSGDRGRGLLAAGLALLSVAVAVYLVVRLPDWLGLTDVVKNLPYLLNVVWETLRGV